MKKKTEAIACRDSKGTEATKVVQTERQTLTDEQLIIILNRLVVVIAILAFTAIVIFGTLIKVIVLAILAFLIVSIMYLGKV